MPSQLARLMSTSRMACTKAELLPHGCGKKQKFLPSRKPITSYLELGTMGVGSVVVVEPLPQPSCYEELLGMVSRTVVRLDLAWPAERRDTGSRISGSWMQTNLLNYKPACCPLPPELKAPKCPQASARWKVIRLKPGACFRETISRQRRNREIIFYFEQRGRSELITAGKNHSEPSSIRINQRERIRVEIAIYSTEGRSRDGHAKFIRSCSTDVNRPGDIG
ncbi:hypothetical protein Baya_15888 [Bagarius yarrelli]|uniref:Uncharacterized protein n=1 Tax=Bagarius yarrelli TaxID=175774 RepID=A0A556VK78_BAGYA|nr:hypothetical protein Baya_15888 [Bagarius yarrelli]